MKCILKTTILIPIYLGLCAADIFAECQPPADCNKTQIVIIGTMHELHYESPKYTPEVIKQIILELKPDAILNELPLSQVDPNGRPLSSHYLQSPENWAADMAATQLGIKQIPFDRPDREENFKKTNTFERQRQAREQTQKWLDELKNKDPNSIDLKIIQLGIDASYAQAELFNAAPEIINSKAFDLIIKIKNSAWNVIFPEIMKKYPAYQTFAFKLRFFDDQWNERNRIMADNIIKAIKQYPGKRLVVLTGAEHRYILREMLEDEPCIDLKEYWELIDFDLEKCLKSIGPAPQAGIVADGLTQAQASQEVARQFWQAVIKKDWELVNNLRPPVEGVNWEQVYSENMPVELIEVKQAHLPEQGPSSGPLAPCVVRFENGTILEWKMVPRFRKIGGKTICFITATWGKPRELKSSDITEIKDKK